MYSPERISSLERSAEDLKRSLKVSANCVSSYHLCIMYCVWNMPASLIALLSFPTYITQFFCFLISPCRSGRKTHLERRQRICRVGVLICGLRSSPVIIRLVQRIQYNFGSSKSSHPGMVDWLKLWTYSCHHDKCSVLEDVIPDGRMEISVLANGRFKPFCLNLTLSRSHHSATLLFTIRQDGFFSDCPTCQDNDNNVCVVKNPEGDPGTAYNMTSISIHSGAWWAGEVDYSIIMMLMFYRYPKHSHVTSIIFW